MRWFSRLFVKIFLSIWMVSLLVVGATVLVISQLNDQQQVKGWLTEQVRVQAEHLIDELERYGGLDRHRQRFYEIRFRKAGRWSHSYQKKHGDQPHSQPPISRKDWHDGKAITPVVRIFRANDNAQVFGPPQKRAPHPETRKLQITSEQGNEYRVELLLLDRRTAVTYMYRYLLSYQIIVILLASALASVLLTWLIVRPINRLRGLAVELHQGNLSSRANRKLIRRRDEIGELAREFNQMADYVESALQSRQRLLQDVSHELRAPLARLQAASGLAEQRLGEDDRIAMRIHRESEQLSRLIDEILSLSRVDDAALVDEAFQLDELINELCADIRFSAPDRTIEAIAEAGSVCCQLPRGRDLLARALNNLLNNALKHTPDDSAIDVSWHCTRSHCVVRVRDHGDGVSEELLTRLFEPFVRADAKAEGYGLGLSIARRSVERLGGQLTAINHDDGGMLFELTLPVS